MPPLAQRLRGSEQANAASRGDVSPVLSLQNMQVLASVARKSWG